MKTINEISLYDLMAEEFDVWVTKSKSFGLNIEIDDENGDPLIREHGVHPAAAASFADFCRSYLASYDYATKYEAA